MCKGSTADSAFHLWNIARRGDGSFLLSSRCSRNERTPSGKLCMFLPVEDLKFNIAELCKGSTADSDSVCLGSNPSSAAIRRKTPLRCLFSFVCGTTTSGRRHTSRGCLRFSEVSRLCIPPSAVSCHARRYYSSFVKAERFFQSSPRAANSVPLLILSSPQANTLVPLPKSSLQIPDLRLIFGRKYAIIYEVRVCRLASKLERLYFKECAKILGFSLRCRKATRLISHLGKLTSYRLY